MLDPYGLDNIGRWIRIVKILLPYDTATPSHASDVLLAADLDQAHASLVERSAVRDAGAARDAGIVREAEMVRGQAMALLHRVRYGLVQRRTPANIFCTCAAFVGDKLRPCEGCLKPYNYLYVRDRCRVCGVAKSECLCKEDERSAAAPKCCSAPSLFGSSR